MPVAAHDGAANDEAMATCDASIGHHLDNTVVYAGEAS
jgi:hypothetical protein